MSGTRTPARAMADGTTTTAVAASTTTAAAPAPTGPAPRRAAEETGAGDVDAAELISGAREHIDVLDARILTLIGERRAVSEQIQAARIGSGGRRVNLARELEILERYRAELGGAGTRLGMVLLELCRGRA